MYFEQFYLGCLAHASYMLGSEGDAVVVDPQRDVDLYLKAAEEHGLTIRHIFETHLHADFVSGHKEMAARSGAQIYFGAKAGVTFAHVPVQDGFELRFGKARINVLETPGHTSESICLLVTDTSRSPEPWFVLTGDTLFVGDVGRPDFGGETAAADLFRSLTRRLLVLDGAIEVYPAHGAGSMCGRAMSSKTASTIGFERRFNPAISGLDEDAFVKGLLANLPPKPPNFKAMVERNRAVAAAPRGEAPALTAIDVRALIDAGAIVLDVRESAEYGEGHVPGAINVWLESPQFADRCGWFIPQDSEVVLVIAGPTDAARAVSGLARVGIDGVVGYLARGMTDWRSAGLSTVSVPQITVHDLATWREERPELVVIDVREPFEWMEGHIDRAMHVPMREAVRRAADVPTDRPKAVVCAGGLRSSTVISALERAGVEGPWYNVAGGMTAWQKAGYPLVKKDPDGQP
jgi:hydroxyacylglutathione hydrolase